MAGTADLLIRIRGDASGGTKALEANSKAASTWSGKLSGAAKVAGAGLLAVGAIAIGGAKAAAEDEKAQTLLAQALRNSAGASDDAVASTEDWISKTALASGVADDNLRPALASLVRATGDVATAQDAMGLALDISAATGKDLQSVSDGLAKGYAGNTAALGKLVPGIDKAIIKSGDMAVITAELAKQTGGASAAAAGTAAGQYDRMQVAMGEAQETIGGLLLPAITALLAIFQPMLASLSQNTSLIRILVVVFAALAATVVVVNAVTKAYVAISKIVAVASKAWAAAQWLVNIALTANPIGIVVVAIVALVAAIVIAYKRSETFRNIVNGAFKAVLAVVQTVYNWIKDNWPLLLAILTGPFGIAVGLIISNFDTIKGAVQSAWNFIKDIWDKIRGMVSSVTSLINKIPKPSIPDLNPFSAAAPSRTAATAAATSAPSLFASSGAGVGAGSMLTRAGGAKATGGGVTVVLNVPPTANPVEVGREVVRVVKAFEGAAGTAWRTGTLGAA